MDEDIKRLLTIIKSAPSPFNKTDSELAQAYKNWFFGSRMNMKAGEHAFNPNEEIIELKQYIIELDREAQTGENQNAKIQG